MSWNYRIIGKPWGYTAEPAGFTADAAAAGESELAIIDSLQRALRDAKALPVLKAEDFPGPDDG